MCLEMASALGKDTAHIKANADAPKEPSGIFDLFSIATRPKDAHLSTTRLRQMGIDVTCISLRSWVKKNFEFI